MNPSWRLPVALACALGWNAASANLLTNGSFESGAWVNTSLGYMDVPIGSTVMTGWTTIDNRVAWAKTPTGDGVVAFDGIHSLDLTGFGNLNPNAGITQTIATSPGQLYRLTFAADLIALFGSPVVVRADAGLASQTFTKVSAGWQTFGFDFTAAGPSTAITLSGVRSPGTGYVGLDAVSVTAVVPEPQTGALALAGTAALAWRLRRRGH